MITRALKSPVGWLSVSVARGALVSLSFDGEAGAAARADSAHASGAEARAADRVVSALARYFAGELHALGDLDVVPEGTLFQRRVWDALRLIPSGTTSTYAAVARAIGAGTNAARAVGAANGANPIAIVVPCHRVVGSDGTLTGYAYGVAKKKWLLDHERRHGAAAECRL